MKKMFFLTLSLILFLCLTACSSQMPYDLSRTSSIELHAFNNDSTEPFAKIVVDGEDVAAIVEMFSSLKLKELDYTEPSIKGYDIWFKDTNGNQITKISLPCGPSPWVVVGGTAYQDMNRGIDLDFLAQLVDMTVSAGPQQTEDGADQSIHEPEAYAFEAQYIRTDGYSDGWSYPYHTVINSRAELDAYYEAYKDTYYLERREKVYSDSTIGFLDACDKYDDAYFERQNLVLIVLQEGSGSIRHEITDVRAHRNENGASLGWEITIRRIVPEVGTDNMAQWHLFLEVQMGNIITDEDDVWINGKLSDNAAVYSEESPVDSVVDPQMLEPAMDEFVLVEAWLPNVRTELHYATENNFTGQIIYSFDNAWLRYGTVQKLAKAQEKLAALRYSLLIWDAFRPIEAQWKLWEVFPDPVYVANPENGFSSHSRGNTVDVTLVTSDGKNVEMPSGFDDFSLLADRDYSDVSEEAAQNALLLETIMINCGFIPYSGEWWHFSDADSYPVDESFIPD